MYVSLFWSFAFVSFPPKSVHVMNDRSDYQYGCLAWVCLTVVSIASLQSLEACPPPVSLGGGISRLASSCGAWRWNWRQPARTQVGRVHLVVENFGMFPSKVKLPYSFVPSSLPLSILEIIFLSLRDLGWEEN